MILRACDACGKPVQCDDDYPGEALVYCASCLELVHDVERSYDKD